MWCDGCRAVGMIHCAHPDECGNMLPTPAAPDYRLAPHLQRIVDVAKTAPQWDTANDRERALMMDALGALVSARDTIRRIWGTTNPERERVISALCKALDVDVVPAATLKGDDHD